QERVHVAIVHEEITERRRIEEDHNRTRQELSQANAAKNLFLGKMSHELRTPLNAILGFSQLLEADPSLTSSQQEQLGHVLEAAERLLRLLNNVLRMSELTFGNIELRESTFEPVKTLEDTVRAFEGDIRAKGLALRVTCHP